MFDDLRQYLTQVEEMGECKIIEGADWNLEIGLISELQLSKPDPYLILAILVGGTMWLQQKMVTAPPTDAKQQSMTQMMTLMMPLMFGMFTLSFPSGLALYWVISNVIGIIIQYFVTGGWGYLSVPSSVKPIPSRKVPPAEQQSKTIKKAYQKKKGFFGK